MQPRTLEWDEALGAGHGVASRVEAWLGPDRLDDLPVGTGTIRIDRGSSRRRQLTLTIPDPTLLPRLPTDSLAPYGVQLRPYRGLVYAGGQIEWMPLGVYRVETPEGELGTGDVTVQAQTLECALQESRFRAPRSSTGMGTTVQAITSLILEVLPDAIVSVRATHDRPIPTIVWDARVSRWEAIDQIARAIGAEVYPDATGVWIIRNTPDAVTDAPVWEITAGVGGTLIGAVLGLSREGIRNGILATGSNSSAGAAPVSGWAVDDDPTSPTWYDGPFGQVDGFYASPLLTSTEECERAARSVLLDRLAVARTAALRIVPNPALEAGDSLLITYPDRSREIAIVESINLPLEATGGESTLVLRGAADPPEGLS